ncbi:MAG: bifunctional glutamate N-acetyltransferase/amino-acid acetyltransferase ArgJ [Planctomycetota bacterium]
METPAQQTIAIPKGFRASGVKCGIKASGNLDLALIVSDYPCFAAGTFTLNRVAAAPVQWDRALVPAREMRGVVVNAGNANAATGQQGLINAAKMAELAAGVVGCESRQMLVASTGVIGHQLPMEKIKAGIIAAHAVLTSDPSGFDAASHAIMTTDTVAKVVGASMTASTGEVVRIMGLCKGAAMIGPRMATMLGFVVTDARLPESILQEQLSAIVDDTFNCISVEGHASTNDTVLLLANGQANATALEGEDIALFQGALHEVCESLAKMIPGDGEGATHRITIDVTGCKDRKEAMAIARAVADSALVKTAIHGADPNWGRIVSAAGYAGIEFQESEMSLWLNGFPLYQQGTPLAFDAAEVSSNIRENRETHILLQFDRGQSRIRFWTCDLTAEYIHLNADYTT